MRKSFRRAKRRPQRLSPPKAAKRATDALKWGASGRLRGRKALVTGGDSGMGRAAAIAFAREGADVAINYLPEEEPDAREVVVESDTFEIMEAYAALAQSSDPKVMDFAREMIHDHAETSQKLSEAAIKTGLKPPPMAVGASQSPFLAALQCERGREFDKTYWQQQALAHRSELVTTQRYAESGDNAAIRNAANAAIPMIQRHLAMAEQMTKTLESGS